MESIGIYGLNPLTTSNRFTDRCECEPNAEWNWDEVRRWCLHEARRILRAGGDPEDAAQEAVLRAWRFRDRCPCPSLRLAWTTRIARNETLRQLGRRVEEGVDELELEASEPGVDPSEEVHNRLTIRAVLDALSADERRLLELRYVADLTQPQVAERLGIPEGTAKVRLHRLRARLKAELDGAW